MIPKSLITTDLTLENNEEPSRTYKMTESKLQGFIDELNALQQAIYKALNTEKYEYPIYSFYYGIELENLIGKNRDYVKIELKRRIRECLLQDERIISVDNFQYQENGDILKCTFDVQSIYGILNISQEVSI
jgi:hypothetical protein